MSVLSHVHRYNRSTASIYECNHSCFRLYVFSLQLSVVWNARQHSAMYVCMYACSLCCQWIANLSSILQDKWLQVIDYWWHTTVVRCASRPTPFYSPHWFGGHIVGYVGVLNTKGVEWDTYTCTRLSAISDQFLWIIHPGKLDSAILWPHRVNVAILPVAKCCV